MGIDRIGGGGPPGISGPKADPASSAAEFKLEATAAPEAASDLQKLDGGEITVDDYLNGRADVAVAHLQGRVGPEQLELIKTQLVEQMKNDPAISRLVQRATGIAQTALAGDSE